MGNDPATLGKYQVDTMNPIGRGAFGAVFVGKDKRTGQKVAVKQCQVSSDSHGAMAMTEIKNYQHLSGHKHLVRLLDYHFKDNAFWLVMEFCGEGDLEDHMKTFKPDLSRQLKIMHQCASALAYMHGLEPKAVHRDIKPNNILFKKEGDELVLKLADFGLATVAEGAGTSLKLQTVGGTIPFMAPEILLELKYNEKVDVFALGMVFLAMIQFKPTDEHLIAFSEEAMKRGELKAIGAEMAQALKNGKKPPDVVRVQPLDSEQIKELKKLVNLMSQAQSKDRPDMVQVVKELENISTGLSSASMTRSQSSTKFSSNLTLPSQRADSDSDDEDSGFRVLKSTARETLTSTVKSRDLSSTERELAARLGNDLAVLAMLRLVAAAGDEDETSDFELGDRVLVEDDEDKVKGGQIGHGGWIDDMAKYLGEEGTVQGKNARQVEVMFHDGNKYNYNPALLTKLKPGVKKGKLVHGRFKRLEIVRVKKSIDAKKLEIMQKGHGGYNQKMQHCLGLRGVVQKIDRDGDIVVEFMSGEKWCLNADTLENVDMSGSPLEGGDLVLVLEDREEALELQKGHGEWVQGMEKCLGKSGLVKKANPEKAVVEVGDKTYIWNPKCLRLIAKGEEMMLVMLKKQLTIGK